MREMPIHSRMGILFLSGNTRSIMNHRKKYAREQCLLYLREVKHFNIERIQKLVRCCIQDLVTNSCNDPEYKGFIPSLQEIRKSTNKLGFRTIYFTYDIDHVSEERPSEFIWISVSDAECQFCNSKVMLSQHIPGAIVSINSDGSEEVRCVDGSEHSIADGYRIQNNSLEMEIGNDIDFVGFSISNLLEIPEQFRIYLS